MSETVWYNQQLARIGYERGERYVVGLRDGEPVYSDYWPPEEPEVAQ